MNWTLNGNDFLHCLSKNFSGAIETIVLDTVTLLKTLSGEMDLLHDVSLGKSVAIKPDDLNSLYGISWWKERSTSASRFQTSA